MFQGGRFHARALDYETSLQAPIILAEQYGASFHASIRFYVEHHPEPVALIVAGRHQRADRTVPIWLTSSRARSLSASAHSVPSCRSAVFASARTPRSR